MEVISLPLGMIDANCHIVINERTGDAVVIDVGDCNDQLLEYLHNDRIKKICYILLTHGHFDHINGVAALKKHYPDVPVGIHELDAPCLSDDLISMSRGFGCPPQEKLTPDIILHDGDELPFGDTVIKVIHTPGHTKGGVTYLIEDCLFTGDTLFCLTVGRTDFPGGSQHELNDSINRLFDLPGDYKVYTGHNRETTLNAERKGNRFVRRKNK